MNNSAAIGYMIIAAKEWLDLDSNLIKRLERAMYEAMDEYTEYEAEEAYRSN
jgi:hypothetical protein